MHDNLIREREGGRLPLEFPFSSQVDIVTHMTKWTRNINLTLNIGLRVSGLSFGFSGSPCFCCLRWWQIRAPSLNSFHVKGGYGAQLCAQVGRQQCQDS